ncbi:MAG: hydroxyacid dehydrogenase [Paracoccaceae bacterium]|nr:hydroxyacid dehydrogenase [Paracoccaceae bacterium]
MTHLVIAGKLHPSGLNLLKSANTITFDYVPDIDETSYLEFLPKADGLVIRTQRLTAQHIATAPNLRIVSRHGVGYDAVDGQALKIRNIPLAIVGDVNSRSVAEHAMMLLLAASRCLVKSVNALRAGDWAQRNTFEPKEVFGKTLLIIGYGRIGRHLSELAKAFGIKVLAYDPFLSNDVFDGITRVRSITEGLEKTDFVSLHIPKADGVILGAAELDLLPRHAVIINTARGGTIDEASLIERLKQNKIGAVGLDVLADEPPAKNNPLFQFDNVIITPHSAGLTEESAERMALVCVQNTLDYFNGKLDKSLVVNGIS